LLGYLLNRFDKRVGVDGRAVQTAQPSSPARFFGANHTKDVDGMDAALRMLLIATVLENKTGKTGAALAKYIEITELHPKTSEAKDAAKQIIKIKKAFPNATPNFDEASLYN